RVAHHHTYIPFPYTTLFRSVGRGNLEQTLFNMAVPPSLRRGDIEVLIAQQQLNVAVVQQLHAARLAFYAALYNRSLESLRDEQLDRKSTRLNSSHQIISYAV